jgi:hypothetical protein
MPAKQKIASGLRVRMALTRLVENWVSPSGVLLVIGGVIWGVQLNVATMNLTAEITTQQDRISRLEQDAEHTHENLLRTTLVLEAMEIRMIEALEHVENHNTESEDWKRRIVVLEAMMERHHE